MKTGLHAHSREHSATLQRRHFNHVHGHVFVNWQNARWQSAPSIIALFGHHHTYVEPYGGSATVLIQKERSTAEVFNDIDESIVALFSVLRDPNQSEALREELRLTPFSRREYEKAFGPTDDAVEAARRLLIRSFMGHTGPGGQGNIMPSFKAGISTRSPAAAMEWRRIPDSLDLVAQRFQGVLIECRPALRVIAKYNSPDTLIYCDPPQPKLRTRHSRSSGKTVSNASELVQLMASLSTFQGAAIVSLYGSSPADYGLKGWVKETLPENRQTPNHDGESLWLNPQAADLRPSQRLFP